MVSNISKISEANKMTITSILIPLSFWVLSCTNQNIRSVNRIENSTAISFKYVSNSDIIYESHDTATVNVLLNELLLSEKVLIDRPPLLKYMNELVFTFGDSSEISFIMSEFDTDRAELFSNSFKYLPSFPITDRIVALFKVNLQLHPAFRKWLKATSRDLEFVNSSDRDLCVFYNIQYPDTSFTNAVLSGICPAHDYFFVAPELNLKKNPTINGVTVFIVDRIQMDSCVNTLTECREQLFVIKKWILEIKDIENVEGRLIYWPSK